MLDFIRRNSIIVILAIVAVAAGLIISDYAGKGDRSGDMVVKVGDKSYKRADVDNVGGYGLSFLQRLYQLTLQKYQAPFDSDGDGALSEGERETFNAVIGNNAEAVSNLGYFSEAIEAWATGSSRDADVNILTTRALIREEGEAYGLAPGKDEIDAFIRSLPAFRKADGSFDRDIYMTVCGYRKGEENREGERAFRSVISDLMVWQSLQSLLVGDVSCYAPMENKLIDVESQEMKLRTAWLPKEKFAPAGDPAEEAVKAFWEENKQKYQSEEERIVSLYTIKALPNADGSAPGEDELMAAADNYMQQLADTNARGMDALLETASKEEGFAHFEYRKETFPLAAQDNLADPLQRRVDTGSSLVTLGSIAFDVTKAPTAEEYEKRRAAGQLDSSVTLEQLRGFYPMEGEELVLIRTEAIKRPDILPYEKARAQALADLREKTTLEALQAAADELRKRMEKDAEESGLDKAFESAAAAGAEVASFGPVSLSAQETLPDGLQMGMLATVRTGGISPLMHAEKGIRIAAVVSRTVSDSPERAAYKALRVLPVRNYRLQRKLMMDWLENAYRRYAVQFGPHVRMLGVGGD